MVSDFDRERERRNIELYGTTNPTAEDFERIEEQRNMRLYGTLNPK